MIRTFTIKKSLKRIFYLKWLKKVIPVILFMTVTNLSFGQVVNIGVSPSTIVTSTTNGNTVSETFTISNTGNAPLNYSLEFYGESVSFEKANNADFTQPLNQDRISSNVIITRGDDQGIFNIAQELSFNGGTSPADTEWSFGFSKDSADHTYENWRSAVDFNPPGMVGQTMSMHTITDDRYYDVFWESWTSGGAGGGFAYTRTEIPHYISAPMLSGSVEGKTSQDIELTFDASNNLPDGTYIATMVITSNAGNAPELEIPIEFTVSGADPAISTVTTLDFGDVINGASKTESIVIENTDLGILEISDITFDNPSFSVATSTLTVQGYQVEALEVTFAPDMVQAYNNTMTLTSNDATSPTVITLTGNGLATPAVDVTTGSFAEALDFGNTSTQVLTINNTGAGDLEWSADLYIPDTEVSFTKEDFADITLEENQDRITPQVWITRGDRRGIFNAFSESSYSGGSSPEGTEWTYGRVVDATPLDYDNWNSAVGGNPPGQVGQKIAMHAITANRYFELEFSHWTANANGGGFSYERREVPGWVTLPMTSGTVAASGSQDIDLNFDANLIEGTYEAQLVLSTNDPSQPEVVIPLTLTIEGIPEISTVTSLDFNDVFVGFTNNQEITITNVGSDALNISDITSDNADFTVSQTVLSILPNESNTISVSVTASTTGAISGNLTITSDASNNPVTIALTANALTAPDINVSHNTLELDISGGGSLNETISIENTQGENLEWEISGELIGDLTESLSKINANYTNVTSLIPNLYTFSYDGGTNDINDGGNDMYDGGNELSTNLSGGPIDYSDDIIADGSTIFGAGTSYFTRHLPGLFVLGADMNDVSTFEINGNLGADGGGSTDNAIIEISKGGRIYQGFIKRVYGTSDPSVNHLIIVEKNESASQETSTDTNNDFHQLSGLSESSMLYYLLYASGSGGYINDSQTSVIMDAFLDAILGVPNFITLSAESGITAAATTDDITISINSVDVPEGLTSTNLYVASNDPDESTITIPITFTNNTVPRVSLSTTTLSFGQTFIDFGQTLEIEVENIGSEQLVIDDISSDNAVFASSQTSMTLEPGESQIIEIIYTPTTEGTDVGVITFSTNDPDNSTVTLDVDGEAAIAPSAGIQPLEGFNLTLLPAETANESILIENTQGVSLDWSISNVPAYVNFSITSGTVASGTQEQVDFSIVAASVPSSRESFEITITTNDPNNTETIIPFEIQVGNITIANDLADIEVYEEFGSVDVDVSSVFTDAEGDALTYVPASSNEEVVVANVSGSTLTINEVAIGSSTISLRADDGNGNSAFANFNVTVLAKSTQEITFESIDTKVFGDASFELVATGGDSGNPVTFTSGNTNIATIDGSTVTIIDVGEVVITASQAGNEQYFPAEDVTQTLIIEKAEQVITFESIETKVYGDANFELVALGGDSGNPITFTSANTDVVTIDGATVTILSAGEVVITASQEGNDQYFPAADIMQTLSVGKAPLTVMVDDKLKLFGDDLPTLSLTYDGFVNGDDRSVIDTEPTLTTDATAASAIGTYAIISSGGSDNNYDFTQYIDGVLTIETVTSINELDLENGKVKLFPNPASVRLQISGLEGSYSLQLIDNSGRIMLDKNFEGDQSIDVHHLDAGIYVVLIQSETTQLRQKFIKE